MFSVRSLTTPEARLIAEAYLRAGRNPNKVGEMLGMPDFDKEVLSHPLVRREVIAIARVNSQNYSLVDHLEKLAEIRDAALTAEKFTAALGAELAIGKASGLYDKGAAEQDENDPAIEPKKLSTEQIRDMLRRREHVEALPPPPDSGNQLDDQANAADLDEDPDTFMEDGCP